MQILLISAWDSINHYLPDNLEYSFDLLRLLGLFIFCLVIANVLPYLFIKFKMVSSDSSSAFIRHYFKAVLIWSVFIVWVVAFEHGIHFYRVIVFFLPTFAAFMIYKKIS